MHRQLNGYRDLALGVACWPLEVAVNEWRCVPSSLEVWHDWAYADATCTALKDVIVNDAGAEPGFPALDRGRGFTGCAKPVRAFQPGPHATFFHREGTSCLPGADPIYGPLDVYEIGPEVSFDLYAKLTPTVE